MTTKKLHREFIEWFVGFSEAESYFTIRSSAPRKTNKGKLYPKSPLGGFGRDLNFYLGLLKMIDPR